MGKGKDFSTSMGYDHRVIDKEEARLGNLDLTTSLRSYGTIRDQGEPYTITVKASSNRAPRSKGADRSDYDPSDMSIQMLQSMRWV